MLVFKGTFSIATISNPVNWSESRRANYVKLSACGRQPVTFILFQCIFFYYYRSFNVCLSMQVLKKKGQVKEVEEKAYSALGEYGESACITYRRSKAESAFTKCKPPPTRRKLLKINTFGKTQWKKSMGLIWSKVESAFTKIGSPPTWLFLLQRVDPSFHTQCQNPLYNPPFPRQFPHILTQFSIL